MADRYLAETRLPNSRTNALETGGAIDRSLSTRDAMQARDSNRVITVSDSFPQVSSPDLTELNNWLVNNASKTVQVPWNPDIIANQQNVTSPSATGVTQVVNDPFLTLADIFRNSGSPTSQPQQVGSALVPVTSQSSSGNFSIVIILLVVGVAGYFIWKKYKSNA